MAKNWKNGKIGPLWLAPEGVRVEKWKKVILPQRCTIMRCATYGFYGALGQRAWEIWHFRSKSPKNGSPRLIKSKSKPPTGFNIFRPNPCKNGCILVLCFGFGGSQVGKNSGSQMKYPSKHTPQMDFCLLRELILSIRKANGQPEVAMPAIMSSDVASQSSKVAGSSQAPYLSKLNEGTLA